jgi:alpha-2-macroglobulin
MAWRVMLVSLLIVAPCVPSRPTPIESLQVQIPTDSAGAASTVGALAVQSVAPEPRSEAVLFDSSVLVQFNRPVVPLSAVAQQPLPLRIQPPVDGSGKWLNTGLYSFTPSGGWAPATRYTLTVPGDVADVLGGSLGAEYSWTFTTLPPGVASTEPARGGRLVDPAAPIKVTFDQPVDGGSVRLAMTPSASGTSQWIDRRTLVYTPGQPLAAGWEYEARVDAPGSAGLTWRFTTAPPPRVVAGSAPSGQVELTFSSPMNRDELRTKLKFEPELDYIPAWRWSDDGTRLTISGFLKPSTDYTVSLPAGVLDSFGRATAEAFELQFRSAATPNGQSPRPYVHVVAPLPMGSFDAYEHPRFLVQSLNVGHVKFTVDSLDQAELVRALSIRASGASGPSGQRLREGTLDIEHEQDALMTSTLDLGALPPGYYALRVEQNEANLHSQVAMFEVTRTALTVKESQNQVMAWAVDLRSGEPLANRVVHAYRGGLSDVSAEGLTDSDGTVLIDLPGVPKSGETPQPAVVTLDRPGDAALAASDFLSWGGWLGAPPSGWAAYVYGDRAIYRPGQTVHLKGIVRADDDAHYSLPPADLRPIWEMRDPQNRLLDSGTIAPSDLGTFDMEVVLSPQAALGWDTVLIKIGDKVVSTSSFRVAEYVRPQFDITLDKLMSVVTGDSLTAGLQSAYYFGMPVANAAVHWRVSSSPEFFVWPADRTFRFGDSDPWHGYPGEPPAAPRTEGMSTTGADGRATFGMPTDLSKDANSQRFTIEATITDPDHSEVSNRTTVVVHKADLYLGLKPKSFVATVGSPVELELVALDRDAIVRTEQLIQVHVLRRRWVSVRERTPDGVLRWQSRADDMPITTLDAQTDAQGRAQVAFTPDVGGEYRIVAEGADAGGRAAHSALSVWVSGPGSISWHVAADNRLELQADKTTYVAGEVAHVIVPSPVTDGLALISLERGKIISHQIKRLVGNSSVLDIPIEADHLPNVYVSVSLFKAGQAPTMFNGTLELEVKAPEQQLQVTLEPDRRQAGPGEVLGVAINTRDADGLGVPAEVSLAVVDAAVLALMDKQLDPLDAFFHRRQLAVRSGGSVGVSIDRLNEQVGRKGGGGGDQGSVRTEFPDSAFWAPHVRTDANGFAHVDIHLPDNLTTWRLTAVGVTADTRLGMTSTDVVTSKPLLLRPLLPRFLVGGDVATLGAAVHNTTTSPLRVQVTMRASGIELRGAPTQTVDVPAGGQARADWQVSAAMAEAGIASVRFDASGNGASDAVQVQLPLEAWRTPVTVETSGEVGPGATTTELVKVPGGADRQVGELRLEVAPSLAAAMSYGRYSVEEFRYECLEQTVSRFLPRLALDRAIGGLGLGDPLHLHDQLPGLVTRSIQRIYGDQHTDGGWGWWQQDGSQPYLTAYALFGLNEARKAGFVVDSGVIDRGANYLRSWLNSDPGVYGLDTRAYVLYVLGELGTPEPARISALFERRADLGINAHAYLAQAIARLDRNDPRIGGLMAELSSKAVTSATGSHWEEKGDAAAAWSMSTVVRTTAGVLDALIRVRPDDPLVQSSVRWLMAARKDRTWESTHDTSLSLLALTDYLATSGDLSGPGFSWQAAVNGQTRASGAVADVKSRTASMLVSVPRAELGAGDASVALGRSAGAGRLYYSLQLQTYTPGEDALAESHGVSVAREYLAPDGSPLGSIHVGDLVLVRLTLLASSSLTYLVLEDPLPGGFEAVDTALKTTSLAARSALSQASQKPGWWWSRTEAHDDRVSLFSSWVPSGMRQVVYLARATTAGEFRVLPARAFEQYFPSVTGRSDGQRLTILP